MKIKGGYRYVATFNQNELRMLQDVMYLASSLFREFHADINSVNIFKARYSSDAVKKLENILSRA